MTEKWEEILEGATLPIEKCKIAQKLLDLCTKERDSIIDMAAVEACPFKIGDKVVAYEWGGVEDLSVTFMVSGIHGRIVDGTLHIDLRGNSMQDFLQYKDNTDLLSSLRFSVYSWPVGLKDLDKFVKLV